MLRVERIAFAFLLLAAVSLRWIGLSSYSRQFGAIGIVPPYVWLIAASAIFAACSPRLVKGVIKAAQSPVFLLTAIPLCQAASYATTSNLAIDNWLLRTAHIGTGMAVFALGFAFAVRDPKSTFWVILISALAVAASGLLVCLQFAGGFHVPWSAYAYKGSLDATGEMGRAVGFSSEPVSLAYAFAGVVAMCVVMLYTRDVRYGNRLTIGLFSCALLGGLGLLIAASRSGLLGCAMGVVAGVWASGSRSKRQGFIALAVLGGCAALYQFGPQLLGYVAKKQNAMEDVRVAATWRLYVPAIAANPLGNQFALTSGFTRMAMVREGERLIGAPPMRSADQFVYAFPPHNGFLTSGVTFGIPGVLALVAIYAYSISACLKLSRAKAPGYATLGAAFLAAIVAVLVHGWFHNQNFLIGEIANWLFVGSIAGAHYESRNRTAIWTQ